MPIQYKDYYNILGVNRDCTTNDIKQAYRKLAHRYHPDVSRQLDAEERFKEINEAYRVLKSPKKRARFDILQEKLEAEWNFSNTFKSKVEKVERKFDVALFCWLMASVVAVFLFSTLLQQFIIPTTLLLMIYLIFEDMELELSLMGWIFLAAVVLVIFGLYLHFIAMPVTLILMFYLVFKKLLN